MNAEFTTAFVALIWSFYAGGVVAFAVAQYPEVRDDPFDPRNAVATAVVCIGVGLAWPLVAFWSAQGWRS